jgi:hypothetical protein
MEYSVDICQVHLAYVVIQLDDLSIGDRRVLKCPTITVLESICVFSPVVYV